MERCSGRMGTDMPARGSPSLWQPKLVADCPPLYFVRHEKWCPTTEDFRRTGLIQIQVCTPDSRYRLGKTLGDTFCLHDAEWTIDRETEWTASPGASILWH